MRADIKAKWLTWLRSGENVQGDGVLATEIGGPVAYCCLGGLCEIAREAGVVDVLEVTEGGSRIYGPPGLDTGKLDTMHEWSMTDLPPAVTAWAGLDTNSPEVEGCYLADLNDSGSTFAEIADLIEKHL